jgi:putative ABC transport system permease protein
MEREMAFHVDSLARDYARDGLSDADAQRAARRQFGNLTRLKERGHDERTMRVVEDVTRDVGHAARCLWRSPGFSLAVILTLALGIGANTAIFSFADALLLRPLPVARPGEVVTIGSTSSVDFLGSSLVSSYCDYVDIRDRSKSFDGIAALTTVTVGFARDANAQPRLKLGMLVSGNLLSLMGVTPTIGRDFRADEDQVPGRDAVIILGRTLWEQEFDADPGVLGRRLRISGLDFTVVGVTPPSFTGMDQFVRSDFYVPLMMSPRLIADPRTGSLETRDARNLTLKGRLKAGVSQSSAQAELDGIAADLERAYPETNKNRRLAVHTELQERVAQHASDAMLVAMLSTLALAVLFVACANVAGLLTSRAPARAREMALRLAIGAGRSRLIRQLVTESLLLAIAGGLLGLGVGYAGMALFSQIQLPTDLPINLSFRMDRRALGFSFLVAVASALVFGLVPAVQATRTDLTAVMKAGDAVAPGRRRRWGRAILVCGQVAVSVVLLVVAMFIYRGFSQQIANGPGYRTDHLAMMSFDPTLVRYTDAQSQQFFAQVAERARAVPGVVSVTMTTMIPMKNDSIGFETVAPEGFPFPPGRENTRVLASRIDEHYFDTIGISILRGRGFRETDGPDAPRVAIVNEQFAKHYWPDQDAIGKRLQAGADKTWVQVVGIAKNSKYVFIAEPTSDFVYLPYRQTQPRRMVMLARSSGEASALTGPLREVVHGLDPNLPIFNVRTMADLYRMRAVSVFNVLVTIVAGMGAMGLGLAIVGLYGLVAYAASRRTREIGIRMAIGAERATVVRLVLRQGVALALVGLAIGLVASVAAGRLMAASFPTGDNPRDLMAQLLVIPIVLAVTLVAAYVPAFQASRINPIEALRQE